MEKTISPWRVIEKLRIKKGISKKIIAEKLQINYNYLVDLLNGRYQSKIDDDKLRTISTVLDISVHKLLDELHGIITDNSVMISEPVEKISRSVFKPIEYPIQSNPIKHPDKKKETDKEDKTENITASVLTGSYSGSKSTATNKGPLIGKTPIFRIVSGSKIDACFNQPELWHQKNLEYVYVPSLKNTADKSIAHQPLGSKGILPATVAIKLEDNSLFPPCLAGSIFIVDATKKPRVGDIVLVVLQNYRAWLMELNKIDYPPNKEKVFFRAYSNDFEPIMVNRKDIIFLFPVTWIHPS